METGNWQKRKLEIGNWKAVLFSIFYFLISSFLPQALRAQGSAYPTSPSTVAPAVSWPATGLTLTYTVGTIYWGGTPISIAGGTLTMTANETNCAAPTYSACNFVYWAGSGTLLSTTTSYSTAAASGNWILYYVTTSATGNITTATYANISPVYTTSGFTVVSKTSTYQVLASDFANRNTIVVPSGTFTVTLVPSSAQPLSGQFISIVNYGSGVVTIAPSGQNINGASTSVVLATPLNAQLPTSLLIWSDGTNYFAASVVANARGQTTVAFSATPTFSFVTGALDTDFLMTLSGNVTSSALSGGFLGATACFYLTQDATGGRTFVWPSNMKNAPPLITTANATYSSCFENLDGTNWYDTDNNQAVALGVFAPASGVALTATAAGTSDGLDVNQPSGSGGNAFKVDYQGNATAATSVQVGSSPPGCTVGTAGAECLSEGTAFTNVSGAAGFYPDATLHEFMAKMNGASSAGMLVRAQPGAINNTGLTAAVSTATLCAASAGACNVAGQYHVHIDIWGSGTACATPGTGGVTPSLTWTDENSTSHAAVVIPMMSQTTATAVAVNTSAPTVPFETALANEGGSGDFTLSSSGAGAIQYAIAYAGCSSGTGTYNIRATVTRVQ